MKRSFSWAFMPLVFAAAAAVSPVGVSLSEPALISVDEATCTDCMKNPDFTCGTPPLDREGYCTAGEPWCVKQQE